MFFVGITGHSIIAATHPGMMEYIPIKTNDAAKDIFEANSMGSFTVSGQRVVKYSIKIVSI